jgi:uncharacterized protein (TIRG00374 family)
MDFSLLYLMKIYLISLFYGNVTPLGLGFNVRIFYLRQKGKVSIEKCIANSLIDGTSGFITTIFLALIGSIILFDSYPGLLPIILFFFFFYVTLFVIFMKKNYELKLYKYLIKPLIPKKYKDRTGKSFEALYEDIPLLRHMIFPFIVEIALTIIASTQVYIIAQAFSIDVPYLMFVLITVISVVATGIIPISIAGLGIREGTFMFLLAPYGVAPQIAFVISLSGYFVKMLIPSIFGIFLSFREK